MHGSTQFSKGTLNTVTTVLQVQNTNKRFELTETLALQFVEIKEKMFNFRQCVSREQTSEVSIDSTAQQVHTVWRNCFHGHFAYKVCIKNNEK